MSDNYAIWRPEHDGHAPPNWREGMFEEHRHRDFEISWTSSRPTWAKDYEYRVPAEALNSPNDDASFDVEAMKRREKLKKLTRLGQEADIDEAVALIRKLSPDELAKHGITLSEPKDWATELWADMNTAAGFSSVRERINAGTMLSEQEKAAIALIRERVVLKEATDAKD